MTTHRTARDNEASSSIIRAGHGIFFRSSANKDGVIQPFALDKFKLPAQVCTDEYEHYPAINTVVSQNPLCERRSIGRPTADHPMQSWAAGDRSVAWVRAADMRTGRRLQTQRIIPEQKLIVSHVITAEVGIISLWC